MTEDERHDRSHATAEQEIGDILWDIFADSERICRATVLLNLLHDEFMAMDDADDVNSTVAVIMDILGKRAANDLTLFRSAGHA